MEDTFHRAIMKYGKFDACYFDNGKQYVARQLKLSLSRLGIRIRHAKIRTGKSKGKVEKFHQVVDAFNREAKLKDMDYADLKDGAIEKLEELKIKISELDEDKTREVIKEKVDDIKVKLDEFTKFIKKKSSPVIKKIVDDLNTKLNSVD